MPTKVSHAEAGGQVAGVSELTEPRPRGDTVPGVAAAAGGPSKCTEITDLKVVADEAGQGKEAVRAKPKKRKRKDDGTTSEIRKRARKATELIVEPVPAETMILSVEAKHEDTTGASTVKSELD